MANSRESRLIGQNVKSRLKQLKRSQRALSQHLGISTSLMSMMLNGKREYHVRSLGKTAQFLNISIEDLIHDPEATTHRVIGAGGGGPPPGKRRAARR